MGGSRSPNYPAIGLSQVMTMAEKLWIREHRTAVPPDVAVRAFGYGALSGNARVAIGSLKQYGLLEKTPKGVRLSDLAVRLLNPASEADRASALREAALTPPLFKELFETHRNASDEAISSFLVTQRRFVPRGVGNAIRSFRDTMTVANLGEKANVVPSTGTVIAGATVHGTSQVFPPSINVAPSRSVSDPEVASDDRVLFLKVGDMNVRIESAQRLTAKHVARVRKYLELAEQDLIEREESEDDDLPSAE